MLQGTFQANKSRWRAFYTWCFGGFHIGYDLGQALFNFLPQSSVGLFLNIDLKSKLFELPELLNKYSLGPVLGAGFAVLALIPAIIEGFIFKRPYKRQHDEWATRLVDKYGVRLFWGALALSVIALGAQMMGYLPIAISTALLAPLALSFGLIALTGIASFLKNLYGSMARLYVYRTKDIGWEYTLSSLVSIKLGDADEVKGPLNNEFAYETQKMSELYDEAYAQLVQQTNQAPTVISINQLGVLSYYDLLKDQSDFLNLLLNNKKLKTNAAKLNAIEQRHQTFESKYRGLA